MYAVLNPDRPPLIPFLLLLILFPFSLNITRDFIISFIADTANGIRESEFIRGPTCLMCLCNARKKIKLPYSLHYYLNCVLGVFQCREKN